MRSKIQREGRQVRRIAREGVEAHVEDAMGERRAARHCARTAGWDPADPTSGGKCDAVIETPGANACDACKGSDDLVIS
jgi:hypothetical protein